MKIKAIERIGEKIRLIDQTKLPGDLVYRDLGDYREIIQAIKRLEVRGAPAIGIAAAYALAIGVEQSGDCRAESIRLMAEEITSARPTAVNLFWAVDRMVASVDDAASGLHQSITDRLWEEAEAIHNEDRDMCRKIGEHGATLINDGATILTHCNTGSLATGGIGTALGVVYTCRDQGKKVSVYADETRPLLQGVRLTAWELQQEGIPVTLICDNTAGMLMRQGRIDLALVGADRIAANGDTANKIGTYTVAVLAKEHGIPFYVAAPSSTFDNAITSGADIEIEERSPIEVTNGFGRAIAPEGITVYSPAFDITPNDLITAFITDTGIHPGGRG